MDESMRRQAQSRRSGLPRVNVTDASWAEVGDDFVIGRVKHPWPSRLAAQPPPFPIQHRTTPFDDLRTLVEKAMPEAR